MSNANPWRIFRGDVNPHNDIKNLPPPPQWRSFGQSPAEEKSKEAKSEEPWKVFQTHIKKIEAKIAPKVIDRNRQRGKNFTIQEKPEVTDDPIALVIDAVNAALYLRRPLLVTGSPGNGKTSLAYAIAYQLQLGPVLYWPITARSTLQEGLYRYDAIARLQDTQFQSARQQAQLALPPEQREEINPLDQANFQDIGRYIDLGPLGTAFLPLPFPRVLLIDEIDKSDINLPNDLLHLFEEGGFKIPELVRMARKDREVQGDAPSEESEQVQIGTHEGIGVEVLKGEVRCDAFPFILMTSNGERDFPPAFLRRCVRVNMPDPDTEGLKRMVKTQLSPDLDGKDEFIKVLVDEFVNRREATANALANDQLLNTVYVMLHACDANDLTSREAIKDKLMTLLLNPLSSEQDNR